MLFPWVVYWFLGVFHATFTPWRQRDGGHQKMSNLRKAGKDQKTWVMKINDGLSKSVLEKYPQKNKKKQCECTKLSLKNRNFLKQILEHTNKDRTKTIKHPLTPLVYRSRSQRSVCHSIQLQVKFHHRTLMRSFVLPTVSYLQFSRIEWLNRKWGVMWHVNVSIAFKRVVFEHLFVFGRSFLVEHFIARSCWKI